MNKVIALIGPTASGKSDLAHDLARQSGAVLLSCDSLAVFRQINIASAKPTPTERADLDYFGLDLVPPCARFGVDDFIEEFKRARSFAQTHGKALVIVGGTGFYLKALLSGLSQLPTITPEINDKVQVLLGDLQEAHRTLSHFDPGHTIKPADRYRLEKALLIALATNQSPRVWFANNPPVPILEQADIYELCWPVQTLRGRIMQRTDRMLKAGLIGEVHTLAKLCPKETQAMRSIGIIEVLDYLQGRIAQAELLTLIATHTAQLAKRQRTFNRGQFPTSIQIVPDRLEGDARNRLLDTLLHLIKTSPDR